ncbi:MAG: AIR synthase-related protein [Candidatus Roizmanbacteria bacterium]|nr:AIR synthase-related protein [Candidatus Roizmanbacteria bacterium]
MISRVEIFTTVFDSRAKLRKKNKKIKSITLIDVYTIEKNLKQAELEKIGSSVSNPVTQKYYIRSFGSPPFGGSLKMTDSHRNVGQFDWAIEIGFLPGVTDNVSHTVRQIIEDQFNIKFLGNEDVYSSQVTLISGTLNKDEVQKIANSLYNPLIQRAYLKNYKQYVKDHGMGFAAPRVKLIKKPTVSKVDLKVSDDELTKIGKSGITNPDGSKRGPLALDINYLKTIRDYFKNKKRDPNDIEVESLAQTWSEHCKHTIFANPIDEVKDGLFKHYIKRATEDIRKKKSHFAKASRDGDFCVSVFNDNSGAIKFDGKNLITHKVETHNSPSALDPFGGAVTGIVGVNRDTLGFGLGAKPVANYYGFCLADPRIEKKLYKGKGLTQPMLSSKRIMNGVIDGVNAGGNQSGIPTPQGFLNFDERFRGKPLVFVGTIGLIPKKIGGKLSHVKKAQPGDYVVMLGGRIGKDGIHGATFSSEAMDSGSPSTAVQIGDPITQKKLSDAIVKEARDMLLYNSITDNGAGGLSCSVSEMAKESGGVIVTLEKVPLKYPGLEPWEIWISESQERMTLSVPKEKWNKFKSLMDSREVEATIIGKFTDSGKCLVSYNGKIIMDIDMDFLHDGLPTKFLTTTYNPIKYDEPNIPQEKNLNQTLLNMLVRLNITSFSFISQQYDYVVQANSVLPPLQGRGRVNADTSVIRPNLDSQKGVVMSQGLYPSYSDIDTYHMAASSIDTAIRNAVAAGADPNYLAILDNFCWCSADDPERLGTLKRAAQACYDYAVSYGTPFISGKDSMFNDFNGYDEKGKPVNISIPPTLLISSIGVIKNINNVVSLDLKKVNDLIYILGETKEELGASEYFAMQGEKVGKKYIGNMIPKVDAKNNKKLYGQFFKAIQKNLIVSSVSIGRGGIAVALAKTAIGGKLGIQVDLKHIPGNVSRDDHILYSESQGRILVSIDRKNKNVFEKNFKNVHYGLVGKVNNNQVFEVIGLENKKIINLKVDELEKAYKSTFKDY